MERLTPLLLPLLLPFLLLLLLLLLLLTPPLLLLLTHLLLPPLLLHVLLLLLLLLLPTWQRVPREAHAVAAGGLRLQAGVVPDVGPELQGWSGVEGWGEGGGAGEAKQLAAKEC